MSVHFKSDRQDWETPQKFFDDLDREFHFKLDACALKSNRKCDRYYSRRDNSLNKDWFPFLSVWMNPPYGREIPKWVEKAYEESQKGCTVVCLVPARTDTQWWHEFCMKGEIRFIKGRLKFVGGKYSAPFPSAVVIFREVIP